MHSPKKIAIVGASGYSGEELVRLISRHPVAELVALTSRQLAGSPLEEIYPKFAGQRYAKLRFIESDAAAIKSAGAEIAFLALPHGVAKQFAQPLLDLGLKVIDLSADFRIKDLSVYEEFYNESHEAGQLVQESVYGSPELYREQIRSARLIASPGCYPTSIILPLAPLLRKKLLKIDSIAVTSMSGVSGAGRNAKLDYLYVECNESIRAYSVPKHRHLAEIEQELSNAAGESVTITFIPHLAPMNRGIHSTIQAFPMPGIDPEVIHAELRDAYSSEPFVRILSGSALPDTKHVAYTNYIDIAFRFDSRTGRVILLSAEDNLVKGAAGQAVQCLNIMCGWPEDCGLD